jgi:hypothetical protein
MKRTATLARHGTQLTPLGTVYAVSAVALGLALAMPVQADAQEKKAVVLPIVFQAAGPTSDSIQSTVDAFRSALGDPNNNNTPGPLDKDGRREINWDGGGVDTTTPLPPVTPFDVFLNTRGAGSPLRERVLRRLPRPAANRAVWLSCSTIRPTARSSARSA